MIWMQIIIGITSSILAAGLFLYLLSKLRPNIKISTQIAKHKSNSTIGYSIKVLNMSSRDAISVKVEVALLTNTIVPDGSILISESLKLKKSDLMVLPKKDLKDKDANYAFRFTIDEALEKLWKNEANQFVRIKIFAQDEMSNFGKVFVQEYRTKRNSIKEGQFKFGDTLEIT